MRGRQAVVVRDGEGGGVDAGAGRPGRRPPRRWARRRRRRAVAAGDGARGDGRLRGGGGPAEAGQQVDGLVLELPASFVGLALALGDGELADHPGHRDLALALLDELRAAGEAPSNSSPIGA